MLDICHALAFQRNHKIFHDSVFVKLEFHMASNLIMSRIAGKELGVIVKDNIDLVLLAYHTCSKRRGSSRTREHICWEQRDRIKYDGTTEVRKTDNSDGADSMWCLSEKEESRCSIFKGRFE